jgi:hypothetical protein
MYYHQLCHSFPAEILWPFTCGADVRGVQRFLVGSNRAMGAMRPLRAALTASIDLKIHTR